MKGPIILVLLLLLSLPSVVQAQFNFTTNNGGIIITGYTDAGGAVTIPGTITGLPVTSVGAGAFENIASVTSVMIPDSVTSIGTGAFENCTGLASVVFPNSVFTIGESAFANCSALAAVYFSRVNVPAVDSTVFQNDHFATIYYLSAPFAVIHNFTNTPDGASPLGSVALSGGVLYSTTYGGGLYGQGTVFSVNTNGSGMNNVWNFSGEPDGAYPQAGVILGGGTLYGTTGNGGSLDSGTAYKITTGGSGFIIQHNFLDDPDGSYPQAGLLLNGSTLYGTCFYGGNAGDGAVFKVNTDDAGSGFAILKNFQGGTSDGANPWSSLALNGSMLYGTTYGGGSNKYGTVFQVDTNGNNGKLLHSFANAPDGAYPTSDLAWNGGALYGTTTYGGAAGSYGVIFKMNTDGTGYAVLKQFNSYDGANPRTGLVYNGGLLYGTTRYGGAWGNGAIFMVDTNGNNYTLLRSFAGDDGANPVGDLLLNGNTLYGTAFAGGSAGFGTLFMLSVAPQLGIAASGNNVLLMWPTNFTGFSLQSATRLGAAANWSAVSSPPVVINGQNTVPDPISGALKYYRLIQQP